ncbi:MAG: SDR family oxidoreductase [Gammaproteobacteria bacterium]|jgi:3-oxoacyl-[acyl-carrier protein] reductase
MDIRIQDKVFWITGAASGVGLHLVDCVLRRGGRVMATDINVEGLQHAARARGWPEERTLTRRQDVSDAENWDALLGELLATWERLDVLLNVAGLIHPGWLAEARVKDIDRHIDVNFKGVAFGCRAAARHMLAQGGGHIVNFASLAGIAPIAGIGLYSASKFAVRAYSLVLAQELAPRGVHVTVICPDAIETPMLLQQEAYEEAALTFSGRRTLTVHDIERAVFDRVLVRRPREVILPWNRGIQARLVSLFPALSDWLIGILTRRGRRVQKRRQRIGPLKR